MEDGPAAPLGEGNDRAALHHRNPAAGGLAQRPARLDREDGRAELRSPTCGSRIALAVQLDEDRRVDRLSMTVQACAFGQASAALVERHQSGRSHDEVSRRCSRSAAGLPASRTTRRLAGHRGAGAGAFAARRATARSCFRSAPCWPRSRTPGDDAGGDRASDHARSSKAARSCSAPRWSS